MHISDFIRTFALSEQQSYKPIKQFKIMTKDEAKELLPIVKALAEGKVIESCDDLYGWVETKNPIFDLSPDFYRIKPEQPKD